MNKIAAKQGVSDSEVKEKLVLEYGALAKDGEGQSIGFKLPANVDVSVIYPYTKCFDEREENGRLFKCYLVYKQTHLMDSREMARLIDGAVYDAKELGIETLPPDELSRLAGYDKIYKGAIE